MEDLGILNKALYKETQDRFELRQAKNKVYYLYDYDENEKIQSYEEIIDILDSQFFEDYVDKKQYKMIEKLINKIRNKIRGE